MYVEPEHPLTLKLVTLVHVNPGADKFRFGIEDCTEHHLATWSGSQMDETGKAALKWFGLSELPVDRRKRFAKCGKNPLSF